MTIQPLFCLFDRDRTTLATTPSPKRIKSAVPRNSARIRLIRTGPPAQLFQSELLHSPVHHLGDVQSVGIAAVDFIDHAELFELLASLAETADYRAVQLHLVNLAVEEWVFGRVGVRTVEILCRTRRDAQGARRADVLDLSLEHAVVVEDLDPLIAHVGDVHHAFGVNGDRGGNIELALLGPGRAPGLDELPILVELRDAGVAVPIGDEDVAGSVPGHVEGLVEVVAGDTRSRRAGRRAGIPA